MTELEAQLLAARLTRIWTRGRPIRREMKWLNFRYYSAWDIVGGQFQFFSYVSGDAHFFYAGLDTFNPSQLRLMQIKGDELIASLECYITPTSGIFFDDSHGIDASSSMPFATKWMPFFRRGCWLCGLTVEATAHEKLEWIQDFSRDEIEAWNLKM